MVPVYYGSIDATPLFLILLSEVCRWTGSVDIARELEQPARRALAWIDGFGDRDGDGFVEYERRTGRGLENQSWKDSGDSQRFRDGSIAIPPIAPAEVQGYVFDAKRRVAELARDAWDDHALAERLETDAARLADAFDAAFWMEDRQAYAFALDREKRQVDALCSNIGHLLWSGIVPAGATRSARPSPDDAPAVVRLGCQDDGRRRARVQPHQLPQRHRLAARHVDRRLGARPQRAARRSAGCSAPACWTRPSRSPDRSRRRSQAMTDPRPLSPSTTRPRAGRRPGRRARRSSACGCCSVSEPDPAENTLVSIVESAPDWLGDLTLTGIQARGRAWHRGG